jgi:hypothetical protein
MKTSNSALKKIFLYSFFLSNYAAASPDDVVNKKISFVLMAELILPQQI